MYVQRLRIRGFRNLVSQELSFPEPGVAIVGDNAQGKSNLLEALHYLETFRSFRGAPDRDLVGFSEEAFHLSCQLPGSGAPPGDAASRTLQVGYRRADGRKKVSLEGQEPSRLADALGNLATVVLCPADTEMAGGSPAGRRRFLDLVLSLNEPGYVTELQRYRRFLAQRNAGLKTAGPQAARAWDDGLLRTGAAIIRARSVWVEAMTGFYEKAHQHISGGPEGSLRYRPSVEPGDDLAGTTEAFERRLRESADSEERMRTTVVGPHRDDLTLTVPGSQRPVSLRAFGSGGQLRTAALALRLTEAETVRLRRGTAPVLLLDDLLAELDAGRAGRVLELLHEVNPGQVVVTAPREDDLRLDDRELARWRIEAGRVFP